MELREHKSSFRVFWVLRCLVILCIVRQFFLHNYEACFFGLLTLVLLYLPSLAQVTLKIEIPIGLEIAILFFIFAAEILGEINAGEFVLEDDVEDIHSQVELLLTRRLGDIGKKIHSGRSRNDQVLVDVKLFLKDEVLTLRNEVLQLFHTLQSLSEKHKDVLLPGYTHGQVAMPSSFGLWFGAYAEALADDMYMLRGAFNVTDQNPLGSAAGYGSSFPLDRQMTTDLLGFGSVSENSMDGVSDRDFAVELANAAALIMMHLSRFSEEVILWCSWEFQFVSLSDAYTTGSSIMPQKKNPDITELIRGKSGRVFGDLTTLLTMMKGLPLAYNKDMQEDKEAIFDAVDTVKMCLTAFTPMLDTMRVIPTNMRKAAAGGFINATDAADYLVRKGVPFRDAHSIIGRLVLTCIEKDIPMDELPLEDWKKESDVFEEDIYEAISLETCVDIALAALLYKTFRLSKDYDIL